MSKLALCNSQLGEGVCVNNLVTFWGDKLLSVNSFCVYVAMVWKDPQSKQSTYDIILVKCPWILKKAYNKSPLCGFEHRPQLLSKPELSRLLCDTNRATSSSGCLEPNTQLRIYKCNTLD